ncbi:MAG: GspH/FimT family pseudopilin [Burkholderiales bacterium]
MLGQRGFTLLEMLIAAGIVVLVTAMSAPTVRESMFNARMSAEASDLMANVALARAEAVRRNERVLLCVSTNYDAANPTCTGGNWHQGYIVFVDLSKGGNHNSNEPLLRIVPPFASGNTVSSGGVTTIPYAPSGTTLPGTPAVVLTFCDPRTGRQDAGRRITVNTTGRPSLARWTC